MVVRGLYTWALDHDGVLLFLTRAAATRAKAHPAAGRTWTHTRSAEAVLGAHAVEFSKTAAPLRRGAPGAAREAGALGAHRTNGSL